MVGPTEFLMTKNEFITSNCLRLAFIMAEPEPASFLRNSRRCLIGDNPRTGEDAPGRERIAVMVA